MPGGGPTILTHCSWEYVVYFEQTIIASDNADNPILPDYANFMVTCESYASVNSIIDLHRLTCVRNSFVSGS